MKLSRFGGLRVLAIAAGCAAAGAAGLSAQSTAGTKAAKSNADAGQACCTVVSVDTAANTITGKVNATGSTFKFTVSESMAKSVKAGDSLRFEAVPGGAQKGFGSGATGTMSGGGSTSPGNNTGRNADTRPKDCVATSSSGAQTKIACPQNVPIATPKPTPR